MALPTAPLSFSQIQTEFGGSNPISLSEYYSGSTSYVHNGVANFLGTPIPISGTISVGDFRGATKTTESNLLSEFYTNYSTYLTRNVLQSGGVNLFTSNPGSDIPQATNGPADIRGGTYTVTWTRTPPASNFVNDLTKNCTIIIWKSVRSSTGFTNVNIAGTAFGTPALSMNQQTNQAISSAKTYWNQFAWFTRPVGANSINSISATFNNAGSVTEADDKGGFIIIPGKWNHYGSTTITRATSNTAPQKSFTLPNNEFCFIIAKGNGSHSNILNIGGAVGTNWLANWVTYWYDSTQVVLLSNYSGSSKTVTLDVYPWSWTEPDGKGGQVTVYGKNLNEPIVHFFRRA